MLIALIAGLALGFVGSIPIAGPISALVLERTLAGQRSYARGVGIGAALAEAAYATLAFVGVGHLTARVPALMIGAKVFGIAMLLVVAVLLARGEDVIPVSTEVRVPETPGQSRRAFLRGSAAGFGIAILNPTLIATWSTTTATLFATGYVRADTLSTIGFALGSAIGIGSWLVLLVALIAKQSARVAPRALRLARRVGTLFLVLVAILLLVQLVRGASSVTKHDAVPVADARAPT